MQIKRFEAKDMTTALRLIKKELGPEAVILSARSLKVENRILGSKRTAGVEVTAATDAYHFPRPSNSHPYADDRPATEPGAPLTRSTKRIFWPSIRNSAKSRRQWRERLHFDNEHRNHDHEMLAGIFKHLLSQGVQRNIANDLLEAVKKECLPNRSTSRDNIIPRITGVLEEKRGPAGHPFRTNGDSKVLAFIGPSGVGKTTSIAKLAVRQVIQHHKKVALITVDARRIAAADELKIYGKAIGIPVKTAATPAALNAAINEYGSYDLILVDTPGINAADPREVEEMKSYLNTIGSVEIHLLLSAGAKEADLFNTIEKLNGINVQYLIFTKLDESITFGNLINLLVEYPLPLSFLTAGRQVPESITKGSIAEIVKCLLSGYVNDPRFSNSQAPQRLQRDISNTRYADTFVANKNSDVYHCPDCKWTQKINPKNVITFTSVEEAQRQQFLPCRDCRPSTSDELQSDFPRKERVRISSYS